MLCSRLSIIIGIMMVWLVACGPNPVVGKWERTSRQTVIEFKEDGTCGAIPRPSGVTCAWKERKDGKIDVDVVTPPHNWHWIGVVQVEGDQLIFEEKPGSLRRNVVHYHRVQ
jgi:hypothetical protein